MESQMMTSSPPLSISSLGCNGRASLKDKGCQKEKVKMLRTCYTSPNQAKSLCSALRAILSPFIRFRRFAFASSEETLPDRQPTSLLVCLDIDCLTGPTELNLSKGTETPRFMSWVEKESFEDEECYALILFFSLFPKLEARSQLYSIDSFFYRSGLSLFNPWFFRP